MDSSEGKVRDIIQDLNKAGMTLHFFLFSHEVDNYNLIKSRKIVELSEGDQYLETEDVLVNLNIQVKDSSEESFTKLHFTGYFHEGSFLNASAGFQLVIKDWSEDAWLLLPGAAYNGNRFESRRISYSPKLIDEKDLGPDKPLIVSDIPRLRKEAGFSELFDRAGSLSHPVILIWLPGENEVLSISFQLTNELGDLGLIFTENSSRDELCISFQSPVVREKFMYTICDNQTPSQDVPYDFSEGDKFSLQLSTRIFKAENLEDMIRLYTEIRGMSTEVKNSDAIDLFSGFKLIENKFNTSNWVEEWGYYSVGMRENFLQDWQVGWTGGMISTYPLYLLGSEKTKQRVLRNFEWFFKDGFAPGGLPWDSGEKGNKWYGGDIRREITANRHLVRKSADAVYYLVKQFFMLKDQGDKVPEEWIERIKKVANVYGHVWEKYGQTGHFLDTRTNEIVIGGSTSGAILSAGLVLLSRLSSDNSYLDLAEKIAEHYFSDYLRKGISSGGVGDALQNIDSESSYALCESFILLFEETRNRKWLDRASLAADYYSTWIMSYNYEFPPHSTHGKLGMKTMGTVLANTQNKHGCPGICTYSGVALLNIYRYTGNEFYIQLLEDIVRAIPQYLSTRERPINGLKEGWVSERINTTDWLEGIGETMNGSTWAETSLMLSKAEIPTVYVDKDKSKCWCFDQFKCRLDKNQLIIESGDQIKLPVIISVLIEKVGENNSNYSDYGELKTKEFEVKDRRTIINIS
jgi:hypothetical protein